MSTWNVKK